MTQIKELGREARHSLGAARWPILDAPAHVDPVPGLYAIHAHEATWSELRIEHRPGIPLYVGKSERSLVDRELGEHFAIDPAVPARTGGSTVRRSFAALLRETLRLHGVPRNKSNPGHFPNYGLEPDADERLTEWMHDRLAIAIWTMPPSLPIARLEEVETDVIRTWTPPINIRRNPERLRNLRVARAIMADEARAWMPHELLNGKPHGK